MRRLCEFGGVGSTCLVATSDSWLRFIIEHRTALASAFTTILHPHNASIATCLNKARFSAWCQEHGFCTPGFWVGAEVPAELALRYPLLIRPADTLHDRPASSGSEIPKAVEVSSREELLSWVACYGKALATPLVTESLLRHRLTQYSVPVARAAGKILSFVAVKRRPTPAWCATGTYVELQPDAAVEALARRVIEALDYFGVGEVEILHSRDTGENYLIEVNARPWLQYGLAAASGHDFLGLVLGGEKSEHDHAKKEGFRWLDFRSDLYVCFSRSRGMVRTHQIGLFEYLMSIVRTNVFAKLNVVDLRPWLTDSWDMIKSLVARTR